MLKRLQRNFWVRFVGKVLAVATVLVVTPVVILASIPVICFMAPVALIAIPFMVAAFFGQSKEALPSQQPLRKLHPQVSH